MTAAELGLKPHSQNARVLAVLADGRPKVIEEIHAQVGTCRLNSRVAELRRHLRPHGKTVACWRHHGTYAYQLVDLAAGSLDETDNGSGTARSVSSSALLHAEAALPGAGASGPGVSAPSLSAAGRAQQSLDESIREDLEDAYRSLDRLMNAVAVSPDADVRRRERLVVVERQIREMEASLQGRERTAA